MHVGNIRNSAADGVADLRRNDAQCHASIILGKHSGRRSGAMLARWRIFAVFVSGTQGHSGARRRVISRELGGSFW
jgi:hypothetical protein